MRRGSLWLGVVGGRALWLVGLVSDYAARVDLLVIGGSGLLGRRVTRLAQLGGHKVTATFCASVPADADVDWRELDIRRRDDVVALVRRVRPDAVINGLPGAIDVRLDSTKTQARLTTRLRGAREFLAPT